MTPTALFSTSHHTSKKSGVSVNPLGKVIGAEILGIDLCNPSVEDFETVRTALNQFGVVVIRDQDIQPQDQVRFAKGLGPLQPLFYNRFTLPNHPEITIVSNIRENGEPIGIEDAGMMWHTDASFNRCPDMYSLLYSIQVPHKDGMPIGDTAFTSVIRAFHDLPEEIRKKLIGMTSTHSFLHHLEKKRSKGQLKRPPLTPEQQSQVPDVQHPVVRRHPNTGLPCLFVSEGHTSKIDGLTNEESNELLEYLWEHLQQPNYQYRHKWRKGDLLIWDNPAVQHLAIFDYGLEPRRMHRLGTAGLAPQAWVESS